MLKKYTTKNRKFKFSPDRKFIVVYINNRVSGYIWNCDKVIFVDGDEIVSSEFFK